MDDTTATAALADDSSSSAPAPMLAQPLPQFPLLPYNDIGNGERMRRKFAKLYRCTADTKLGYIFDPQRNWILDHDDTTVFAMQRAMVKAMRDEVPAEYLAADSREARDKVEKHLAWCNKSGMLAQQRGAIRNFKTSDEVRCLSTEFDQNDELLAVSNGTLNLRAFQLSENKPEHMISRQCGWSYDPTAPVPWEFKRILLTLSGNDKDYLRALQTRFGYALTGLQREKEICFLFDEATNLGKSALTEVFMHGMGSYAYDGKAQVLVQAGHEQSADHHTASLIPMLSARFVRIDEMSSDQVIDSARLKKFTSGSGALSVRDSHGKERSVTHKFKLRVSTNSLPRQKHSDIAAFARLGLFPVLGKKFYRYDRTLKERLLNDPKKMSGVLNWALEGLRYYWQHGLATCSAMRTSLDQFRKDCDPLDMFLNEWAEGKATNPDGTDAKVALKAAYEHYRDCSRATGDAKPYTLKGFSKSLRTRGFRIEKSNGVRWLYGLSLLAFPLPTEEAAEAGGAKVENVQPQPKPDQPPADEVFNSVRAEDMPGVKVGNSDDFIDRLRAVKAEREAKAAAAGDRR